MEVETRSVDKPSSTHVDSPGYPQCTQSSAGNAQMQPNIDPCEPRDSQTIRWSHPSIDPCDPP